MTVWTHPVQLIQAADKYCLSRYPQSPCVHLLSRRPEVGEPLTPNGYVTHEQVRVDLTTYVFDFEDTLGWSLMMKMGLCQCGMLHILETCYRRTVGCRNAYGKGHHHYVTSEERVDLSNLSYNGPSLYT